MLTLVRYIVSALARRFPSGPCRNQKPRPATSDKRFFVETARGASALADRSSVMVLALPFVAALVIVDT